ncbi:hypothetical protein [Inconstantimicrobium mannanitabidum]|uniref:Integrase n=1 Tax=Inconstantimicrobium mannanitabidum TaxID=1604901 RepID=A0ACB5RDR5_9CLOT|nr:hypothetical protein [Clostridium sp. TW13]GKX66901.1 integrase [Clostridium sp. TW13]
MSKKTTLNFIKVEEVQYEEFNLNQLVQGIKNSIEMNDILLSSKEAKGTYHYEQEYIGEFNENLWIMRCHLSCGNAYFDFSKLEKLRFKNLITDDIILIKCWIAEMVIEQKNMHEDKVKVIDTQRIRKKYSVVVNFIRESLNFNAGYLDEVKGSKLECYFDKFKNDKLKEFKINTILDYIDYIFDKVPIKRSTILIDYIKKLRNNLQKLNIVNNVRKIPSSKDILLFANYVDIFFSDENLDDKLKLYYMPILIWWKVTSIIPMRPSEFAIKLKRNSLLKEDKDYYLEIDRVKKRTKFIHKSLPVLKRVKITKEIYDMINIYIEQTNKYGYSETLISYNAIAALRKEVLKIYPYFRNLGNQYNDNKKIDRDVFTNRVMGDMLKSFYSFVIQHMYADTIIQQQLKPGDTRHIAFTSLLLQGYSPIEIAILGGHTSLKSLDNYTCSTNLYIDSEVLSIIKNNINILTKSSSKLIDKVFNMPKQCPVSVEKCFEAEIDGKKLGYCTADYIINHNPCESDYCDKCSKWWCEPTEFNFLYLEKIIKYRLQNKDNKLKRDIEFLLSIMKELGIEINNGEMIIDNQIVEGLKRFSVELNSSARDIINLKSQLIYPSENNNRLISDIQDLLPTEEVTRIVSNKSVELKKQLEDRIICQDQNQK